MVISVGRDAAVELRGAHYALHPSRVPFLPLHLQQSADAQAARAHRAATAGVLLSQERQGLLRSELLKISTSDTGFLINITYS